MNDDKLKILKTEVTSILASSSSPLTIQQFLKEYKDVIGRHFPWAMHGYKNPTEFLKSMPDVVSFKYKEGVETLTPTENNSSHITKLVREQRKNLKKGTTLVRRRRPVQLPRDTQISEPKPFLQLEVPNPTAVRGWERCQPIPSLMSLPSFDLSSKNYAFTSSNYSQFSQNLLTSNSFYLNTVASMQAEFTSTMLPLSSKKVSVNDNSMTNGHFPKKSNFESVPNGYSVELKEERIIGPAIGSDKYLTAETLSAVEADPSSKVGSSEVSSSFDGLDAEEDNCPIGDKMKDNFRKILRKHKNGLLVSKLASSYFKMFNISLNCQDFGFPTIKDLVMSCHDVFKIQQKKHTRDWILFDIDDQSDDSSRWIPKQVLENMQELSLANPRGVSSEDIPRLYKKMFKVDLDINKLGFSSLNSFLVNCQSIECCSEDDKYIVFPVKWGKIERNYELEESNTDPFLSVDTFSIFSKKYFHENVCDYKFKYKKCPIPNKNSVKVMVADCISPDLFWLQTVEAAASLNNLMYELNLFYDEEEDHYLMNKDVVHKGLACCAKFENAQWHRGLIKEVFEKNEAVKVLFVDYGTSSVLPIKDLRTLHRKFSDTEIQSFKCCLFNVQPVNNKCWTEDCLEFFYSLVLNRLMIAEIVEVTDEGASVILVDTNGSEDKVVNFMLIEKDFALHKEEDTLDLPRTNNYLASYNVCEKKIPVMKGRYPDYFLKLLPNWLNYGRSWRDIHIIFEQASYEFWNNACDNSVFDYLASLPEKLPELFVKKPKAVCDAWNKTFLSFKDDFEKRFLENIESELFETGYYVDSGTFSINQVSSSHPKAFSNPKENCDKNNVITPKNTSSVIPGNGISGNSLLRNVDKNYFLDESSVLKQENSFDVDYSENNSFERTKGIVEQNKDPKIIPANLFHTVIHLIRYDSEIYIVMDELITKFAKGIPSMLVQHRLYQRQIKVTPFIVSPEHKILYNELKRFKLVSKNGSIPLVPLSLSTDILLAVEPRNKTVAQVLQDMSSECYSSEEFWTS